MFSSCWSIISFKRAHDSSSNVLGKICVLFDIFSLVILFFFVLCKQPQIRHCAQQVSVAMSRKRLRMRDGRVSVISAVVRRRRICHSCVSMNSRKIASFNVSYFRPTSGFFRHLLVAGVRRGHHYVGLSYSFEENWPTDNESRSFLGRIMCEA